MKDCFILNSSSIEKIHNVFKDSPSKTLREELAMGHGQLWDGARKRKLYDSPYFSEIIEDMRKGSTGNWKQYGCYSRSDIWNIWKSSETVPMIDSLFPKVLDQETKPDLETLSEICQTRDGVLLAIKAFVIKKGMEEEFRGYHPQTSPVINAELFLFDHILSRKGHKELCERWAVDFGSTPTGINTFLWLLGIKLKRGWKIPSNTR